MAETVLNTGHLSTPKRAALDALASGASKLQAATVAGRSRRTVDRWIAGDADFRAAYRAITDAAVADAARRLAALLDDVIDALTMVMFDPAAAAGDKLRAASIVLSSAERLLAAVDYAERIAHLEQRLDAAISEGRL